MAKLLITYDLMTPGQDYFAIERAIHELGPVARYQRTCWGVDTSMPVSAVLTKLQSVADQGDKIAVFTLNGPYDLTQNHSHARVHLDNVLSDVVPLGLLTPSNTLVDLLRGTAAGRR